MADNTILNVGSGGDVIATDDINGVKHQLVKVQYGAENEAVQVSDANPLPTTDAALAASLASIDTKLTNPLPTSIQFSDSPSIDAFGRLRTSEPRLLIDLKRVGSTPDLFSTTAITGEGSATYSEDLAATLLAITDAGTGKATRQTKTRAIYQPGKSLLTFVTFVLSAGQNGLRQRVGFFDDNNGIFFENDNAANYIAVRTSTTGTPADTRVLQADWNVDKCDGTGPSGTTLDFTQAQILFIDAEWLGVGRVRIGFVVNGLFILCHEFLNANNLNKVYMSNPNLPVRWEIEAKAQLAAPASLSSICASVSSEGGYEIVGITSSCDAGTTGKSIASGGFVELLAIRLQTGFKEFATAFIQSLSVINTTTGAFLWRLVYNPTETTAGSWGNVPGSVLEKNSTRVVTIDTGITFASGFVTAGASGVTIEERPVVTLGTDLSGVTDVVSLQIVNLTNQSETLFGSLTWREIF